MANISVPTCPDSEPGTDDSAPVAWGTVTGVVDSIPIDVVATGDAAGAGWRVAPNQLLSVVHEIRAKTSSVKITIALHKMIPQGRSDCLDMVAKYNTLPGAGAPHWSDDQCKDRQSGAHKRCSMDVHYR